MKKRCFVFALILTAWLAVKWVPTNRVTVVNESGQTARDVCIEMNGRVIDLGDIPAGGSTSAWFGTPSNEDHIAIRGRLKDGTAIDEPCCVYIVWEEYFCSFVIVIREGGTASPRYRPHTSPTTSVTSSPSGWPPRNVC